MEKIHINRVDEKLIEMSVWGKQKLARFAKGFDKKLITDMGVTDVTIEYNGYRLSVLEGGSTSGIYTDLDDYDVFEIPEDAAEQLEKAYAYYLIHNWR